MDSKQRLINLVTVLTVMNFGFAGEWPRELHVYHGSTPNLDGIISPNEYEDATRFIGTKGWTAKMIPVTDSNDLSLIGWVKHDGNDLYFAFDVTDDVLYGIDTPRWVPSENPEHVHDFTIASYPWFGDGIELLINASNKWSKENNSNSAGDGCSWQVVCNLSKSLLGGIGNGGLVQGEPRDNPRAWTNYEKWIRSHAMQAVAKPKAGGKGYIIEWMIKPDPCLEVMPHKFWNPSLGMVKMGLNIGVQDLDEKEKGQGNFGNFHHEDWWTGEKDKRTWLKQWGTMIIHPDKRPIAAYIVLCR